MRGLGFVEDMSGSLRWTFEVEDEVEKWGERLG